MASWPTIDDAQAWIGSDTLTTGTIASRLPAAFSAALATIQGEVDVDLMPVPVEGAPQEVPEPVRQAVSMLTHRLLVRADSPTGSVGMAEYAFRIAADDPDIRRLIRRHTMPGIA